MLGGFIVDQQVLSYLHPNQTIQLLLMKFKFLNIEREYLPFCTNSLSELEDERPIERFLLPLASGPVLTQKKPHGQGANKAQIV